MGIIKILGNLVLGSEPSEDEKFKSTYDYIEKNEPDQWLQFERNRYFRHYSRMSFSEKQSFDEKILQKRTDKLQSKEKAEGKSSAIGCVVLVIIWFIISALMWKEWGAGPSLFIGGLATLFIGTIIAAIFGKFYIAFQPKDKVVKTDKDLREEILPYLTPEELEKFKKTETEHYN
jgi:hypothetical protein